MKTGAAGVLVVIEVVDLTIGIASESAEVTEVVTVITTVMAATAQGIASVDVPILKRARAAMEAHAASAWEARTNVLAGDSEWQILSF